MDASEVLKQLEKCGTEQNRKTYRRHGADENVHGVSYADFKKFKKTLKTSQTLAEALWHSGNHDARILATMIADPKTISVDTLDGWIQDVTNYVLADAVAGLAADSPAAMAIMERWTASDVEWICGAGWSILAFMATRGVELDSKLLKARLKTIEGTIHGAKNRVRHCMNGTLMAIAIANEGVRKQAMDAASRIGKVVVDHGDTGCKTPDAIPYIEKALARKA